MAKRAAGARAMPAATSMPWASTGNGDERRPGGGEAAPRPEIAGILDPGLVGELHQRPRDQAESALEAGGDQDLLGSAGDAPGHGKMAGDGRAQWLIACSFGTGEIVGRKAPHTARRQPRPELARKGIESGQTHL
jgi:hypothetical protein